MQMPQKYEQLQLRSLLCVIIQFMSVKFLDLTLFIYRLFSDAVSKSSLQG